MWLGVDTCRADVSGRDAPRSAQYACACDVLSCPTHSFSDRPPAVALSHLPHAPFQAGNQEDVEKYSKRAVKVTRQHNEECKQLLRLMVGAHRVERAESGAAGRAGWCARLLVSSHFLHTRCP